MQKTAELMKIPSDVAEKLRQLKATYGLKTMWETLRQHYQEIMK